MIAPAPARAWWLNFDAEDELADPSAHTPSRAVEARSRALAGRVGELLGPGDVILSAGVRADGLAGRAWCPTPRALAAILRAGATVPQAPPLEVLRRVNHRRFCAELGQALPGARFVTSRAELDDAIAVEPGAWLLKRPFGFAGRGRRRVVAGTTGEADERWIAASFAAREGLQVEPWVVRAGDFGLHGYLSKAGALTLGAVTRQRCDDHGAWSSTEVANPRALTPAEHAALAASVDETASALAAAGYFGPFGVDAYRFLDRDGLERWNPRSEINARYSMGWAIGMGARRPDLDVR